MKYPMKRIFSVLLVFVMSLSLLVGCNSTNKGKNKNNGTSTNNANNGTSTNNTNNGTSTNNANTGTSTNNANTGTGTNNANNGTNTNNANTGPKAGTYTATAKGYSSDVKVTVTVAKDGAISDIKVDASGETPDLGGKAAPSICEQVKKKQSTAVDTVTGATITSNATLTAITEALSQAGVDLGKVNK